MSKILGSPQTRQERKEQMAKVSRELLESSHYIATESDRLLLMALRRVEQGAKWTKEELKLFGRYIADRSPKLRVEWRRGKTPKERFVRLLESEAERMKLQTSEEEFQVFSQQLANLIDLVLSGTIQIADIGFEQQEAEEEAERPVEMFAGAEASDERKDGDTDPSAQCAE